MKQKTLLSLITLSGKGLHTGVTTRVTVSPAPVDHGLVFFIKHNQNTISIPVSVEFVDDLIRGTSLKKDGVKIHTVEHLLSACYGLGITNASIECDGCEIPILDGSAKPWVDAFQSAGIEIQSTESVCLEVTKPISIVSGDSSLVILPYDGFKITCTSTDERKTHTQNLSLSIDDKIYSEELAAARTFCFYEDIEHLSEKTKGGIIKCDVEINGDTIISDGPLRYSDEFVRHEMLDIIGDLALLGHAVKCHIIAIKPCHALNAQFVKAIRAQEEQSLLSLPYRNDSTALDIYSILKLLPHRYPFIMVDRVLTLNDDVIIAIKNVTINEPCFAGHYPEYPVFPGVLQIEAMAQTAGLLLGTKLANKDAPQRAFFMSADNVKFRQPVQPGDQIRIEIKLLKVKNNSIGYAEGQCFVKDKVVSSAKLMFMIENT